MNIFDKMPDLPPCPHCGHDGDGLSFAFPDTMKGGFDRVACACLACGKHGAIRGSYAGAIEAFKAGLVEEQPA